MYGRNAAGRLSCYTGSLVTQALSVMRGSITKANIAGRLSFMQALSWMHDSMRKANTAGRLSETQL